MFDMIVSVGICKSSCSGVEDGKYQSCEGCTEYVVCKQEVLERKICFKKRTWDDNLKKCQKENIAKSSTCPETIAPSGKHNYVLYPSPT